MKVNPREIVPLPMAWKRFAAKIPRGMNNKKKQRMRIHSTTPEDNIEELDEYEKMNDSGSAKMNNIEHMAIDENRPNFTP